MSNKTQLQTNNTNLASYTDRVSALIDVANSLPEAGGSGGGSVETCNVNITFTKVHAPVYPKFVQMIYTHLADGKIESVYKINTEVYTSFSLDNIICGSFIWMYLSDCAVVKTDNCEKFTPSDNVDVYVHITASNGETAYIMVES
jgi:hypothetical protein